MKNLLRKDELLENDNVVVTSSNPLELEELLVKALSPYYREYLVKSFKRLICESIRLNESDNLVEEYIYFCAEAMNCSDVEIIEKLRYSIEERRDEQKEDFINDILAAATLPL